MSIKVNKDVREKNINTFLNDFYKFNHPRNKILFDNIKNIYILISFLNKNMETLELEDRDFRIGAEANLREKANLIDGFYKSIRVDFKLDKIINEGTFEILGTNPLHDILNFELTSGHNNYHGEHKSIEVYNNGLLTDSIIWVHEISHYRNQTDIKRGQVNELLTELLAFTESFIYVDYLEKQGYKKEATMFKISEYKNLHHTIKVAYLSLRVYLLCFLLGEVSKENYKYLYKEEDSYDNAIDVFEQFRRRDQDAIFTVIWYSIATIAIYNYERYKIDNNYIEIIKELNNKIQTDITLEDALKIIDIKLDSESLNKILNSINVFKSRLIKEQSNCVNRT